jgi:lipid-A-disaccharide synthase-like uncharacterized protein
VLALVDALSAAAGGPLPALAPVSFAAGVPFATHVPIGWQVIAWLGNACYFSRFLLQWIASERAGRTEVPRSFWWLSVVGSILVGLYTWRIGQPVLLLSYLLVLAIYVRNLFLRGAREGRRPPSLVLMLGIGLLAWVVVFGFGMRDLERPQGDRLYWTIIAVLGMAIWNSRFIVQWLKSERRGVAYFPKTFWWLSLVGNTLVLAYVIHLGDTALIAGFAIGPLVQVRNLMIAYRERRIAAGTGPLPPVELPADIVAEGAAPLE